ncbi:MAG: toxin-antitoxin system HicB family antitoxin [Solirubrobacteraceae bacterium]
MAPVKNRREFMVRMPTELHAALSATARREGRSMNQLVADAVVALLAGRGVPVSPAATGPDRVASC